MLTIGDPAPDFELMGTNGDEMQTYQLSESLSEGPVVLAFYPQDFSPVCTEELCTLHEGDFFSFVPGVNIFGISIDGIYSHQEFVNQHDLSFPLLADDGDVAEAYGVRYEQAHERFGTRVTKRSLFIVDQDQTVQYAWKTDDVWEQPDMLAAKDRLDEVVA